MIDTKALVEEKIIQEYRSGDLKKLKKGRKKNKK
jgi:hypothetical protein